MEPENNQFNESAIYNEYWLFMKQVLKLLAILIFIAFVNGCLSSAKNEIPLLKDDLSIKPSKMNETKLVIFNDTNFGLFGTDGSETFQIKLNGKIVSPLGVGHYAQVIIPKGFCEVDLVQWRDLKRFSSQHKFEFNGSESFLRVYATDTSNEAQIVAVLPPGFENKFKAVK